MNRQVPEMQENRPVVVVGNGRVARHMIRYFELVGRSYKHWFRTSSQPLNQNNQSRLASFKRKFKNLYNRKQSQSLTDVILGVDTVLLLIPDDQIEPFIDKHSCLRSKTLVHFSGSLNVDKAYGCHPLMTFGNDLYELDQYQSIPFVVDELFDFKQVFPGFNNPVHTIKPANKHLYHAYCVMAGNFTQMLWQATASEMQKLGLPADLMHNYLLQNTQNFIDDPQHALTGPFVRGDFKTIEKHQHALNSNQLAGIYQSFYDLYHQSSDVARRSHS